MSVSAALIGGPSLCLGSIMSFRIVFSCARLSHISYVCPSLDVTPIFKASIVFRFSFSRRWSSLRRYSVGFCVNSLLSKSLRSRMAFLPRLRDSATYALRGVSRLSWMRANVHDATLDSFPLRSVVCKSLGGCDR